MSKNFEDIPSWLCYVSTFVAIIILCLASYELFKKLKYDEWEYKSEYQCVPLRFVEKYYDGRVIYEMSESFLRSEKVCVSTEGMTLLRIKPKQVIASYTHTIIFGFVLLPFISGLLKLSDLLPDPDNAQTTFHYYCFKALKFFFYILIIAFSIFMLSIWFI